MFTNIFFLFLILLLIGTVPDIPNGIFLVKSPLWALSLSLGIFGIVLGLIWIQNRFWLRNIKAERRLFLANLELIGFFIGSYFLIGAQRVFFLEIFSPFNITLLSIFTLTLYFGGLFIQYYLNMITQLGTSLALTRAKMGVRFLLPFALPFMILVVLGDASFFIPYTPIKQALGLTPWSETFILTTFSLLTLIGTIIFLPPLLVYIWNCQPLENHDLVERLERLCRRARFTHAGFRIWMVMAGSLNAAIIGVVGHWRYIMFTPTLLQRLSPDTIEAILAHEIGHNRHKHLLLYPLVLFGMLTSGWLGSAAAENWLHSANTYTPLILFGAFIISCAIYFRLVFGYFSRLFERQADLFIFEVDVPATHMINALDEIAHASGGIHKSPSWHHYSIQERIEFLQLAEKDPSVITKHHRTVRCSLLIYLVILGTILILL